MTDREFTIDDWLDELEQSHPKITPDLVVEMARDPQSPAHAFFEWNDAVCGVEYRREQARALLARRVTFVTESYSVQIPRYVRDPSVASGAQGYVATRSAATEQKTKRDIIERELDRVDGVISRTRDLAVAFGVEDEFDSIRSTIVRVRRRLDPPADGALLQ